jgi:alkylation response protein AidB-like acyl-CoA dehydrogenase
MDSTFEFESALSAVFDIAEEHAEQTDVEGRFPRETIEAFLESGLAGLIAVPYAGRNCTSLRNASRVVERLAQACGSTAMIVAMHYCGAAVIEAFGTKEARTQVSDGKALTTLAFSEKGSRSHFWAPVSSAVRDGAAVLLSAQKGWVTSANHADLYVWSSRATNGEGSSIWLMPKGTPGVQTTATFDGMGLRGNDSGPVEAGSARLPASSLLGEDGKGSDVMLGVVLPIFSVLNASAALGLMRAGLTRTIAHASSVRFEHIDQPLNSLPTIRAYIARMQLRTDMVAALLTETLSNLESSSELTMLRVLEIKAAAGEGANEVLDSAMRICGGAAFRKEIGIDRYFRDARANSVMAPTTDQLYDFIGRAVSGIDLFG